MFSGWQSNHGFSETIGVLDKEAQRDVVLRLRACLKVILLKGHRTVARSSM